MSFERPESLHQVAQLLSDGHPLSVLKDFYHAFNAAPRPERLSEAPEIVGPNGSQMLQAYLQAVAVHLSMTHGWRPPEWTEQIIRAPEPWFASPGKAMRHLLLQQSPAPFRERNIFITSDALGAV